MSLPAQLRALLGRGWRGWQRTQRRWYDARDRRRVAPPNQRAVHIGGLATTATEVSSFDAWAEQLNVLNQLRLAFERSGVEWTQLRSVNGHCVVAVARKSIEQLSEALTRLDNQPGWIVRVGDGWTARHQNLGRWASSLQTNSGRAVVFRALASESGQILNTWTAGVALEIWGQIEEPRTPRPDGGYFDVGTYVAPEPHATVPYLAPETWARAHSCGGLARKGPEEWLPHLRDVTEPIDAVYTWVDGSDPEWMRRRDEALVRFAQDSRHESAVMPSRFVSRDELRYSLRSLEMYANWIRRVHIVTDGQVPSWLNTDNPRIVVVDHRDIFSDPSALPVFNSHAIESQLHHIPDLSDRYLYINDDVFFGRPVEADLFFEGNGLVRFYMSSLALDLADSRPDDMPVLAAAKNHRTLLEKEFQRTVTRKFRHTPHPQRKDVLFDLEQRYPQLFDQVSRSAFRHHTDVSVASALHHYYAYATARAVPGEIRAIYRDISVLKSGRDLERIVNPPGNDVFCLNDTDLQPGPTADRVEGIIREFLESQFSMKSEFEK